jgi:TonB family protein
MPEYPGGFYGLGKYIEKKQKEHSFWEILKGSALLAFTVDEKGKVTRIKVAESDNEDVARAAVVIAQGMADWKPGMQRGKPVPVNYTLPIEF